VLNAGAVCFVVSLALPAVSDTEIGLFCAIFGLLFVKERPLVFVAACGNLWLFALLILYVKDRLARFRAIVAALVTLAFAGVDVALWAAPSHGISLFVGYYVWVASHFAIAVGLVLHAFEEGLRS
jgi:hypothetical protein